MDKLKKQIILFFIISVFGSSVTESIVDSIFTDVIMPIYAANSRMTGVLIVLYFAAVILIFVMFAYIFYHMTNRAIQKESKRQLNERNILYSCIAHDLKTPMTSVQGFAAALREGKVRAEEQEDIYDIIYSKSCYMNELLDTMFTYSKLNTDDYVLSCKERNINSLVRELVALHYNEFENREMEMQIEIPEESILCRIDEKEMKRAISNLLINAYKHNDKGAKIMVKVENQGEDIKVTVADDGREIPAEEEELLFEPFAKGDEARSGEGGNGLGLVISRLIVEKHGGRLNINHYIKGYTKGFVINLKKSGL